MGNGNRKEERERGEAPGTHCVGALGHRAPVVGEEFNAECAEDAERGDGSGSERDRGGAGQSDSRRNGMLVGLFGAVVTRWTSGGK